MRNADQSAVTLRLYLETHELIEQAKARMIYNECLPYVNTWMVVTASREHVIDPSLLDMALELRNSLRREIQRYGISLEYANYSNEE